MGVARVAGVPAGVALEAPVARFDPAADLASPALAAASRAAWSAGNCGVGTPLTFADLPPSMASSSPSDGDAAVPFCPACVGAATTATACGLVWLAACWTAWADGSAVPSWLEVFLASLPALPLAEVPPSMALATVLAAVEASAAFAAATVEAVVVGSVVVPVPALLAAVGVGDVLVAAGVDGLAGVVPDGVDDAGLGLFALDAGAAGPADAVDVGSADAEPVLGAVGGDAGGLFGTGGVGVLLVWLAKRSANCEGWSEPAEYDAKLDAKEDGGEGEASSAVICTEVPFGHSSFAITFASAGPALAKKQSRYMSAA